MKSAKFKDSPLGPIPQDWEIKRLGEVGDTLRGVSFTPSQIQTKHIDGTIALYRANNIQGGQIQEDEVIYVISECVSDDQLLRNGDILVCAANGSRMLVGKAALINKPIGKVTFGAFMIVFRCNHVCNSRYVSYYFQSAVYRVQINDILTGSAINNLNPSSTKALEIALPPLPEQQRIAEALGEVDKLIESLDAQIEKKRRIAQGLAHDLLGMRDGKNEPIRRLPGFKGKWERKRLDDIGTILKGSGICRAESNTGNIPAIRYGEIYTHHNNIVKQYVSFISEKVALGATQLKVGDVVFAGSGETVEEIGKSVAILDDGVYAGGDTIVFSPKMEVAPIFWGYLLNEPYVQKQKSLKGQGATIVHIRPSDIAAIEVCFPKLAEQQAIAEVLAAADSEITGLEAKKRKYEQIKSGMMHDLLTGKVRLKGE